MREPLVGYFLELVPALRLAPALLCLLLALGVLYQERAVLGIELGVLGRVVQSHQQIVIRARRPETETAPNVCAGWHGYGMTVVLHLKTGDTLHLDRRLRTDDVAQKLNEWRGIGLCEFENNATPSRSIWVDPESVMTVSDDGFSY